MRVLIAAAIGVAAAAGAFQSNAPAISHEYADVNGEVNGLIREYLGQR